MLPAMGTGRLFGQPPDRQPGIPTLAGREDHQRPPGRVRLPGRGHHGWMGRAVHRLCVPPLEVLAKPAELPDVAERAVEVEEDRIPGHVSDPNADTRGVALKARPAVTPGCPLFYEPLSPR